MKVLAEIVADIGELTDRDEFRSQVLTHLRRAIPCEVAAYNEVGATADEMIVIADPPDSVHADAVEAFAAHADQNPLIAYHADDPHAAPARLSDFISARALHALDLYDLVYRPLSVEHQAAVALPAADRVIGITASRGGRDFDDRELRMLQALRPFLVAALANIEARRRIDATLAALAEASAPPAAILIIGASGAIEPADVRSEQWLASASGRRTTLLEQLERWAREPSAPPELHRIHHPSGPHVARHVPACSEHPAAILVESPRRTHRPADLDGLGLTSRQGEVLLLAKAGLTNAEIAIELGLSPRTVAHHLEHVFSRLGVSSRTAAIDRVDGHLRAAC